MQKTNKTILNTQQKRDGLSILIIVLAGLSCLNWFRGEYLINPADYMYQTNPVYDFFRRPFAWQEGIRLGGYYDWRGFTHIVSATIPFLLHKVSFSIYTAEKIIFYTFYSLSGISSYYAMRLLFGKNVKYASVSSLAAANFYMMNPFVMSYTWGDVAINNMYLYSINPLLVLFFVKGLSTLQFRYSFYFALCILWASPSLSSPPYFAGTVALLAVIFLSYCFTNKDKIKNYLLMVGCFFGVVLLLNMYWIIYYIDLSNVTNTLASAKTHVSSGQYTFTTMWGYSSFLNIFRMTIYHFMYTTTSIYELGDPVSRHLAPYIFWWAHYYFKPVFIAIAIFLTCVYFGPLALDSKGLYTKEQKKFRIIVIVFVVLFIFLTKGAHPPFGDLFAWCFSHIPGFVMFRGASKFLITLCVLLSFLIGFSVNTILNKVSLLRARVCIVLLFLFSNIYFFPMWLGFTSDFFLSKIPDYYYSFSSEINSDKTIRKVLVLPDRNIANNMGFRWERGFLGIDVLTHLIERPAVYATNRVEYYFDYESFLNYTYEKDLDEFITMILKNRESLAIDAIVLHKDMDYVLLNTRYNQKDIENSLDKNLKGLATKTQIGKLVLYRIDGAIQLDS